LRWHIQSGLVVIPKAADARHLADNGAAWDFALSEADMARISALDQNQSSFGLDPNIYQSDRASKPEPDVHFTEEQRPFMVACRRRALGHCQGLEDSFQSNIGRSGRQQMAGGNRKGSSVAAAWPAVIEQDKCGHNRESRVALPEYSGSVDHNDLAILDRGDTDHIDVFDRGTVTGVDLHVVDPDRADRGD